MVRQVIVDEDSLKFDRRAGLRRQTERDRDKENRP
jgi:hypothetical protein